MMLLAKVLEAVRRMLTIERTKSGHCAKCGDPLRFDETDCMGCWAERQW